ncbi:MAG: DUF3467 domain-containing protein [Clostridiales bacterium]|nr:DUF3467 domain-containing protein [Clostridiales bacterium]MCF8023085.1 DUF3467 domain-containing protein [Clostridiales bacterium]
MDSQKPNYYCNIATVQGLGVNDIKIGLGIKKDHTQPPNEEDYDFYVLVSPQHLKSLVRLLTDQLKTYEKIFGEINLEPNEQSLQELGDRVEVVRNT